MSQIAGVWSGMEWTPCHTVFGADAWVEAAERTVNFQLLEERSKVGDKAVAALS